MAYQSTNPADDQTIQSFAKISETDLKSKMAAAAACAQIWENNTYPERAVIVAQAAAVIREQVDPFAKIMTLEMEKRITEAKGEVESNPQIPTYFVNNAERFLAPVELNPTSAKRIWRAARLASSLASNRGTSLIIS
ncbi:aldehyde dehydrogenase family protein [Sphingomonas sp.]|uniref:aldehyde dehydrogenase family protein n=1 Tax=Sphingomonas sp. TaxID=28214 RepID=UPI0025FF5FA4|nr:aldehyde dehydrogenase family protein [Sphingomonas sp.]